MEIFCKVKEPRVLGKVKHELEDVLRKALIGVLCYFFRGDGLLFGFMPSAS